MWSLLSHPFSIKKALTPPRRKTSNTKEIKKKVWTVPNGHFRCDCKSCVKVIRLCRSSWNAFWISISFFTLVFLYRKPQKMKKVLKEGKKCKIKKYTRLLRLYACGEREGNCAVENCNLGRNVRNSSIVNLSPINGIKIYGVHTHSLSHTFFFLLLMPLFSYMPNRVNLWGLFHLGRSFLFPLYSFDTKLCVLFHSQEYFCWLVISVSNGRKYRMRDRKSTFNS